MILFYSEIEVEPGPHGGCDFSKGCVQFESGICTATGETVIEGQVCRPLYEELVEIVTRCVCQPVQRDLVG